MIAVHIDSIEFPSAHTNERTVSFVRGERWGLLNKGHSRGINEYFHLFYKGELGK